MAGQKCCYSACVLEKFHCGQFSLECSVFWPNLWLDLWWTVACFGPTSEQQKPVWLFHAIPDNLLAFLLSCVIVELMFLVAALTPPENKQWFLHDYRYLQNDKHEIKVTWNLTWQGGFIVHHASSEQSFQSSVVFNNQERSWQFSSQSFDKRPTWLGDQWTPAT